MTDAGYGERWQDGRSTVRAITVGLTVAGSPRTITSQSCRLCGWSLSAASGQDTSIAASTTAAAAAAGSLTLTGFALVDNFVIEPAGAWPAGVNQVTITNVAGGTQTYDLPAGTSNPLVINFVPPLPTTATAVISVPAIVGGPAYSIDAEGQSALTGAQGPFSAATLLDSGQPLGQPAALAGLTDTQWLADCGIYVSTNLILNVASGSMQGVLYIRDDWEYKG